MVILCHSSGTKAYIDTRTPIMYLDITLEAFASFSQTVPESFDGFVYVWRGSGKLFNVKVQNSILYLWFTSLYLVINNLSSFQTFKKYYSVLVFSVNVKGYLAILFSRQKNLTSASIVINWLFSGTLFVYSNVTCNLGPLIICRYELPSS